MTYKAYHTGSIIVGGGDEYTKNNVKYVEPKRLDYKVDDVIESKNPKTPGQLKQLYWKPLDNYKPKVDKTEKVGD